MVAIPFERMTHLMTQWNIVKSISMKEEKKSHENLKKRRKNVGLELRKKKEKIETDKSHTHIQPKSTWKCVVNWHKMNIKQCYIFNMIAM